MTRDELINKFYNTLPCIISKTKAEILKDIHTRNNIECEIGNPEWFTLSTNKLRKMLSKIKTDLNLNQREIYNMDKNCIIGILFSLDMIFKCYKYSLQYQIYHKKQLIVQPEIQKKYIYLGATMGKDFSYYLTKIQDNIQDNSICLFIKSNYFGIYANINHIFKYAIAYEQFINENKYEHLLKEIRRRQILQEQQLSELRTLFDNFCFQRPERPERPERPDGLTYQESNFSIKTSIIQYLKQIKNQIHKSFSSSTPSKHNDLIIDASCSVCYSNKKNILYMSCNHISSCEACSERVGLKCPLCRKKSDYKILVYL